MVFCYMGFSFTFPAKHCFVGKKTMKLKNVMGQKFKSEFFFYISKGFGLYSDASCLLLMFILSKDKEKSCCFLKFRGKYLGYSCLIFISFQVYSIPRFFLLLLRKHFVCVKLRGNQVIIWVFKILRRYFKF